MLLFIFSMAFLSFRAIWEASCGVGEAFGAVREDQGGVVGSCDVGEVLATFWWILERSWAVFGTSWGVFGTSCGDLWRVLVHLGASL